VGVAHLWGQASILWAMARTFLIIAAALAAVVIVIWLLAPPAPELSTGGEQSQIPIRTTTHEGDVSRVRDSGRSEKQPTAVTWPPAPPPAPRRPAAQKNEPEPVEEPIPGQVYVNPETGMPEIVPVAGLPIPGDPAPPDAPQPGEDPPENAPIPGEPPLEGAPMPGVAPPTGASPPG